MAGRVASKFYFSLHFTLRYSSVSGLRCLKWLVPRNDRCAKILEMMKSLYSKWGADHSGLRGGTSYLYSPVRTLFVLFGGVGRRMTKFPPALSIQEASSTRPPSQKVERMGTPVSLEKKSLRTIAASGSGNVPTVLAFRKTYGWDCTAGHLRMGTDAK